MAPSEPCLLLFLHREVDMYAPPTQIPWALRVGMFTRCHLYCTLPSFLGYVLARVVVARPLKALDVRSA